jgi:hypothetical protein
VVEVPDFQFLCLGLVDDLAPVFEYVKRPLHLVYEIRRKLILFFKEDKEGNDRKGEVVYR